MIVPEGAKLVAGWWGIVGGVDVGVATRAEGGAANWLSKSDARVRSVINWACASMISY